MRVSYSAFSEVRERFESFEDAVEGLSGEPGVGVRVPTAVSVLTDRDSGGAHGELVSGGLSADDSEVQAFVVPVSHEVLGRSFVINYIVEFGVEVESEEDAYDGEFGHDESEGVEEFDEGVGQVGDGSDEESGSGSEESGSVEVD